MSWWNAKYKNDHDEYEITFGSKYKEKTKIVEKVCKWIIDKLLQIKHEYNKGRPYLHGGKKL